MHFSLVTFTGEQDCVPIDRHAQRMGDCLPAIGDSYEIVAFAPASVTKAAGDLCDDGIAVLGVRIVVGDDCIVSEIGRASCRERVWRWVVVVVVIDECMSDSGCAAVI